MIYGFFFNATTLSKETSLNKNFLRNRLQGKILDATVFFVCVIYFLHFKGEVIINFIFKYLSSKTRIGDALYLLFTSSSLIFIFSNIIYASTIIICF